MLVWLGLAGLSLLAAHRDVRAGLRSIESARRGADVSAVVEGRLLPELRVARARFGGAHERVSGLLLAPVRVLPVVGRQIRSVRALSGAAAGVSDTAIAGMTEARPILAEPGRDNAALASTARRLGDLAARADGELARLRLGPREGLLTPLADARNRLTLQLAELRDSLGKGGTAGTALADVLTGPRRYLLFAANNAEMRAGSGMFLSAGELETGPDGMRLTQVRSVTDIPVPPGSVPLEGDLADRWGWLAPNVEWRNLMTSPRFDAAAPLAAQMWVAAGNRPVDGVIALDPVALRGLLSATGAVDVDGRRIDEGNVEKYLLHDQYARFSAEDLSGRRDDLGRVATAVFASLDAGSWSLPKLASGLASAGGGRHLLMWSAQPTEQAAWQALAVDGSLRPDSVLLSVISRTGNKLDQFLRVAADVVVRQAGDDSEVTLTVRLENRVPEGEPPYVVGAEPRSGVAERVYLGILAVNLPAGARDARFEGVESLAVAGGDGPSQVMGFQLTLEPGASQVAVARFRLPGHTGSFRIEPSARVPAIAWTMGDVSWSDYSVRLLAYRA